MAQETTTEQTQSRGLPKTREGIIISDKMNQTVVVEISRLVKHPQYGKYVRRTKKCYAHDGENQCGIGDKVRIVETRPLSKKKRWRVQKVLEKAVEI